MFPGPIFELHITNVHRREAIYHNSLVSKLRRPLSMDWAPTGIRRRWQRWSVCSADDPPHRSFRTPYQ